MRDSPPTWSAGARKLVWIYQDPMNGTKPLVLVSINE